MKKIASLKRAVLRSIVASLAILIVFGGIAYGIDAFLTQKQSDAQKLRISTQMLSAQIDDLEKKINLVESSIEKYRTLKAELDARHYTLDREEAKKAIDQMRQDFRLDNLKLEVTPEQAFSDPQLVKYTTTEAVYRDVKISFDAISDLHVYAMIEALPQRLPGFVKITDVHITRGKLINEEALTALAKGSTSGLVSAEIDFMWIGLHVKAAAPPAAGAVNAPR